MALSLGFDAVFIIFRTSSLQSHPEVHEFLRHHRGLIELQFFLMIRTFHGQGL
jgi:hypothetical protein